MTTTTTVPLSKSRNYLLWLAGDTAQELGIGLGSFAMPLITLATTGSPSVAGSVAAVQAIGAVIGFLPGGVIADRWDRKRLRSWSALIGIGLAVGLVVLALVGWLNATWLIVVGFLMQLRSSLLTPASEAMLRTVVEKAQVAQAVANNQGRDAAVGIVSGPLGGVLYAVGPAVPFVAQAVSFAALFFTNLAVDGEHKAERSGPPTTPWRDFVEGLSFLKRSPFLMQACLVIMLINLAATGMLATVIMILQLAGHRPETIGLVSFVVGAGALLGALAAGWLVKRVATGRLMILALAVLAGAIAAIATSPTLPVILASFGVSMLTVPSVNAALGGLLMHVIPNEMLGRLQSVLAFLTMAMTPLGPAIGGWGLALLGEHRTLAIFAGVAAAATALALLSPRLRRLPAADDWESVSV